MSEAGDRHSELGEDDRAILEFERENWGAQVNKESAVRERFSLSLARYYQRVYTICGSAEALAYDAVLVRNIREAALARETLTRPETESGH